MEDLGSPPHWLHNKLALGLVQHLQGPEVGYLEDSEPLNSFGVLGVQS